MTSFDQNSLNSKVSFSLSHGQFQYHSAERAHFKFRYNSIALYDTLNWSTKLSYKNKLCLRQGFDCLWIWVQYYIIIIIIINIKKVLDRVQC